ncbi:hypothetical protein HDU87_003443 [Geranomyces variabilis]|uniref:Alpha/beta hydrolase fold-3 domain-containing protein n=1 Tax=Geranomyces variabilis TaxID=109894 RepID=A0AAD5XSL1_9FUNG|nr:hypothetical protein HDU87_003443 [Geranomyces variabilis]
MESRTLEYKKAPDGHAIFADVHWLPSGVSTAKPVALLFHQGGFVVGTKDMIPRVQIEDLARLGFIVVNANYRLCPQVSVYEGPVQDAKDALAWIRNDLSAELAGISADPDRVVAVGYSAGGTLALTLGAVDKPVKAVLDVYGGKMFRDPSWSVPSPGFLTRPKPDAEYCKAIFNEPTVSATEVIFGSTAPPTPRAAWMTLVSQQGTWLAEVVKDGDYERVDPLALAAKSPRTFPPVFTIHGTDDTFVPYSLSERFTKELKDLAIDATLVPAPGKNHLFDVFLKGEEQEYKDTILKGFQFLANHV